MTNADEPVGVPASVTESDHDVPSPVLINDRLGDIADDHDRDPLVDVDVAFDVLAAAESEAELITPVSATARDRVHDNLRDAQAVLARWLTRHATTVNAQAWALDEEDEAVLEAV